MGNICHGPTSDPVLIKKLIKETFTGAKSQVDVDKMAAAFFVKLKELGIKSRPLVLGEEQIVFHEKYGGVIDGYKFTFPDRLTVPKAT